MAQQTYMLMVPPITLLFGGHVKLEVDEGGEWSGSGQLLGKTESHRNERVPKVVHV
jgi:hypothetical protein